MIDIKEIINEKLKQTEEPRAITHWHPSKLGQCLRGVYLERLGVAPDTGFDERTLRVFYVGKKDEELICNLIKGTKGYRFQKQVRVSSKELDVAGYADLFVKKGRERKLYEIKSKHSKAFWYMNDKGEGANQHHRKQLWLYLFLLGVREGEILYVEKDSLSLLSYPVFLEDKKLEKEVMNELYLLNKAWKEKNPEVLPLPENNWQARYCRWHKQCIKI